MGLIVRSGTDLSQQVRGLALEDGRELKQTRDVGNDDASLNTRNRLAPHPQPLGDFLLGHATAHPLLGNRSAYHLGQVLLINLGHDASHLTLDGWLSPH
ncbi:hypothetical protein D9M69_593730 [compost metagenome]